MHKEQGMKSNRFQAEFLGWEDVYDLQKLENHGVDQVIIGKAIYEGNIQLSEINLC